MNDEELLEVARLGLAMCGEEIAEELDISDKELNHWIEWLDRETKNQMKTTTSVPCACASRTIHLPRVRSNHFQREPEENK